MHSLNIVLEMFDCFNLLWSHLFCQNQKRALGVAVEGDGLQIFTMHKHPHL